VGIVAEYTCCQLIKCSVILYLCWRRCGFDKRIRLIMLRMVRTHQTKMLLIRTMKDMGGAKVRVRICHAMTCKDMG
jgi:hypothetical protein